MRIGVRAAISILVLTSIIVSAIVINLLWWRTADDTSRTLAAVVNDQIVSAVGDELQSITAEAKSAHIALNTLLVRNVLDSRDAMKREFVFLSQLQSQQTLSWVVFGWPDGSFFGAHKLGDSAVEMIDIAKTDNGFKEAVERYELVDGDFQVAGHDRRQTTFDVTRQEWFHESIDAEGPQWFRVKTHPVGERSAVAYAGPIDVGGQRVGVLGIVIELTRVSQYLSHLTIGKSASAFILDRDGSVIAAPDAEADEIHLLRTGQPDLPVAMAALHSAAQPYNPDDQEVYRTSVNQNGEAYAVTLTPISFPGWSVATVIPESIFLGPVQATIRQLLIGLAVLIAAAGLLSAWLAQRLIAAPLIKVVGEIRHVERFELDRVQRHSSKLVELENLSGAIADMASGLSAFRKYIPADLVRTLLSDGVTPHPGGTIRPMTVMFADIAGFTGLSERLGPDIIPLLSRYLDAVAAEVSVCGGTIDKFIGDAVMAFWGAPRADARHAENACRAALACQRAVRDARLVDNEGQGLRIRIGINSGDMLVGNIGSDVRLNYTVIGDSVNVASRLEGANKIYGTDVIIGEETRRLAGERIIVRELDRLAVYGRAGGMKIYELLALSSEGAAPDWIALYEDGLSAYRARNFEAAITRFKLLMQQKPGDGAAAAMIRSSLAFLKSPPESDWDGVTVALQK
jgi:adenylate cyclase